MSTFEEVLQWIASGPGALAIMAWAASWMLEELAWWAALKSKVKSLIILGVSALLGVGATAMLNNPAILEAVNPYMDVVVAIAGAWLATQVAHKFDKDKEIKPETRITYG